MSPKPALRVLLAFFAFPFSALTPAETWYVDDSVVQSGDGKAWETALKTIQEGIDAASDGDTVTVSPGTYVENIHFQDKNIVLQSMNPYDPDVVAGTVIDGNHAGPAVTFGGEEDETCILAGFTIQSGRADLGGGIRGRTFYRHTHATIERNMITGNSAGKGAGMYNCAGIIQDNVISGNIAQGAFQNGVEYGIGAGLAYCHGTIRNNTITGNSTRGGGCPTLPCVYSDGGGLAYCQGIVEENLIIGNSADRGGGLYSCNGTIQNNVVADNDVAREGGGLAYCDGTVRGNIISGNSANDEGGGLGYCDGTIEHNTITENVAHGGEGYGGHGGGLSDCDGRILHNVISKNSGSRGAALSFCDGTIEGNTITGNSVKVDGGALYFCNGTIQANTICGNHAERDGGGLHYCLGTMQSNVVAGNSAGGSGGGIALCAGAIQNNTVCGNSAFDAGGGLYLCKATIVNCIIWGNAAGAGAQVYGSTEPMFCCIENWPSGGEGNIFLDPMFADAAAGDYHLQADSPCIDAGANFYWFVWPQRDMDGNCRLAGRLADIGCYEYGATADTDGDLLADSNETAAATDPQKEDTDGDGLRDGLERLRGSDPLAITPPRTVHVPADLPGIQMALLLAVKGEEIVVAPGTYRENLHFYGTDVVLRSTQPENANAVCSTILNGSGAGPVVSFKGGESEACVISGFTITGGEADCGGGIHGGESGQRTRATIQHNIITGNSASSNFGGGVYACDGTIQFNTITENRVARYGGGVANCGGVIQFNTIVGNCAGGYGGGLYGCHGTIGNNTIAYNITDGTFVWRGHVRSEGGGLAYCDGIILNNKIILNRSLNGAGLYNCDGAVRNNLIAGNHAEDNGGGLYWCQGTMHNNTIVNNSADGTGGGIYYCTGASAQNCIIWGNIAPQAAQIHLSGAPIYSCIENWTEGGTGNIAEEPLFVDPDGLDGDPYTYEDNDYHLLPDSPCIDAGRNEDWMWEAVNADGKARIANGRVDLGWYEYCTVITAVRMSPAREVQLTWTSQPGEMFAVWSCAELPTDQWTEELTIPSQGKSTTWSDPDTTAPRKLYRIETR